MSQNPREPTADECSAKADLGDGWYALWWPQMGGYVGKAAAQCQAETSDDCPCIDVFVWHDGEFPFTGNESRWPGEPAKSPVRIHICDTDQWRHLADVLDEIVEKSS